MYSFTIHVYDYNNFATSEHPSRAEKTCRAGSARVRLAASSLPHERNEAWLRRLARADSSALGVVDGTWLLSTEPSTLFGVLG